jgi:hypothetical protein
MIKRIALVLLLLGLSGCTLPDYIPPADTGTNAGTPALTPVPTLTQIIEETTSLPTLPVDVTETLPADGNDPQSTGTPAAPREEPTSQPQVVPTPYIYTRYLLQSGSPAWVENFVHPEAGCNWMGLGGQVFNLEGIAVPNLVVKLTGTLNGDIVDLLALTGGALNLGPGGYEFKLSDHPISSTETIWVSIFDQDGNAISNPVAISTYDSCDKNFVVVNFTEAYLIENGLKTFLPFISMDLFP